MVNFFKPAAAFILLICSFQPRYEADKSLFPDLPGWNLSGKMLSYDRSDLFNYIDGAADNFISYDFENLTVAEYHKGNEGIKAEIYVHSDPANGFGIYSSERFPDYHFLDIGSQAYTSDDILNMSCGKYYVKLFSETKTEEENKTLITLAKRIADHLGKNASFPAILKFFPEENKQENTEQYINQGFLGYEFLSGAYTAEYSDNGKKFKLFIIDTKIPEDAEEMLKRFLSYNDQNDEIKPGTIITIDDRYNGIIPVILKNNFILGCMNLDDPDMAQKYLNELSENI